MTRTPTALATGGTSGIGRATAQLLHARGYRVIATGQRPASVAAAQREVPEGVLVVRADARSLDQTDYWCIPRRRVGIGATRGLPGAALTAASKGALLSMVPTLRQPRTVA